MSSFSNIKYGKLAIILENDYFSDCGKNWLAIYLYDKLEESWDIDLLIISSQDKPIKQSIYEHNARIFYYSYDSIINFEIDGTTSQLIKRASEFRNDIAKALPLYNYLINNIDRYDAYVFVGLTYAIIPLLPLTKKKNCMIPLLKPRFGQIIGTNPAIQLALLNCDYFFCHSEKEAKYIRIYQPYAEIRVFPIMLDLNYSYYQKGKKEDFSLDESSALIITEYIDKKVEHYATKLKRINLTPYIIHNEELKTLDMNAINQINFSTFVRCFYSLIDKIKIALFFMQDDFFFLLYNLAQHSVPIYLSRDYIWNDLIDIDSIGLLSLNNQFDEPIVRSSLMFEEFHHYQYYNNYLLKFVNDWCVDNKIRTSILSKQSNKL